MIERQQVSRIFAPLLVAVVGTLFLMGLLSSLTLAGPGDLFVSLGGSGDCSQSAPCDLHTALAQAGDGDTVYIAQGTYTGTGLAVIIVTKSITLYGGWDGAATPPPMRDPETNPTTLDGEGQRRVAYISGDITPTLEGLRITNGSTGSRGGGIAVDGAHPVISGCRILNNTGKDGGGVFLGGSVNAILMHNEIYSNAAQQYGGGVASDTSLSITLTGNRFYSNTAQEDGGAISLWYGDNAKLLGNDVYSNTANRDGGGIYIRDGSTFLVNNVISYSTALGVGGGVYLDGASVTLTGNHVYGNAASDGGGIYLHNADDAMLTDNRIYGNRLTSYKHGGGVYLSDSNGVTLVDNWVYSNTARYGGGGLYLSNSFTVTLASNHIVSNTTNNDYGGGVYAVVSGLTLTHNIVRHNTAFGYGGGLAFVDSEAILDGNQVVGNVAGSEAGMSFERSTATLVNNVVADNVKMGFPCASGIGIKDSTVTLMHNTIARNRGFSPGSGIYVMEPSLHASVVTLVNNILVSHTVGITVAAGNTATLEATLWGDGVWANETAWGGGGDVSTGTINVWGDPGFVDPDSGDYHVRFESAAVDQGVDVGVMTDLDGDRRPIGAQPDIGADEVWHRVLLPLVLRNYL